MSYDLGISSLSSSSEIASFFFNPRMHVLDSFTSPSQRYSFILQFEGTFDPNVDHGVIRYCALELSSFPRPGILDLPLPVDKTLRLPLAPPSVLITGRFGLMPFFTRSRTSSPVSVSYSRSVFASRWCCFEYLVSRSFARLYEASVSLFTSVSILLRVSSEACSWPVDPPYRTSPISSLNPNFVTMLRATFVALAMSLEAPEVVSSFPKMSSSATRPPMATSMFAFISLNDCDVWSPSGNMVTIPSDWPRGMMVAL
mmetsp:Transcript_7159/g.17973  ORF Transcript_7159/g.17973 Transcript_7159/m.17973 type:complete len:256 (+) Transcript_7159:247-1014(+)